MPKEKPCKWAEYAGRTSCCGAVWRCSNPASPRPRASDKFCRTRCPHREEPETFTTKSTKIRKNDNGNDL